MTNWTIEGVLHQKNKNWIGHKCLYLMNTILAKIKIYNLSRAKLLFTLWDEIPCNSCRLFLYNDFGWGWIYFSGLKSSHHIYFHNWYVDLKIEIFHWFFFFSLLEGVNLLVSSGTASAIAGDRLRLVKRKTARQDDTKVYIKAS